MRRSIVFIVLSVVLIVVFCLYPNTDAETHKDYEPTDITYNPCERLSRIDLEEEFLRDFLSNHYQIKEEIPCSFVFDHDDGTRNVFCIDGNGNLNVTTVQSSTREHAEVYLSAYSLSLKEGEIYQLYATAVPLGQTSPISWTTPYVSSISVSSTGLVTAIGARKDAAYVYAYMTYDNQMYFAQCMVYVIIRDGTYCFKNKSSNLYADATGYSAGSEVLQWIFHGAANQRWAIRYEGNGEYTIENWMSGMYLGIEASNNTNAKTTQYSTATNLSKWCISKTSSGAYCLYAKGNLTYNYVIGAASSGNTAGMAIKNMSYTNDNDFKDEWELELVKKDYINYYDSSFAINSNWVSCIPSAVAFSNAAFEYQFGCSFRSISFSRKYDVVCDQCPMGMNEECDYDLCDESCINHHKNIHNISNQLYNPLLENTVVCLWTNREDGTYCIEDTAGDHNLVSDGTWALVYDYRPVVQVLQIDENRAEFSMGYFLAHETAHTFGLPDDYIGHNKYSALYCIMQAYSPNTDYNAVNAFYLGVLSGDELAFCSDCESTLFDLIFTS